MHLRAFLILLSALTAVPAGFCQNDGLRVELTADRHEVPNLEKFSVSAKIINAGLQDQPIQIWLCSYYESWVVDNPFVTMDPWACSKNPLQKIVLKPGEVYENTSFPLILSVGVPVEEILQDSVTFRLGFKRDILNAQDIEQPLVWSEPLTIQITEK